MQIFGKCEYNNNRSTIAAQGLCDYSRSPVERIVNSHTLTSYGVLRMNITPLAIDSGFSFGISAKKLSFVFAAYPLALIKSLSTMPGERLCKIEF